MWLAYAWDDWAIPWAGIAAALAGTGSLLSGYAALKMARQKGKQSDRMEERWQREHPEHEAPVEGGEPPRG